MALMNEGTPAEAADEQSELFVTMDFAGECWDVWFPKSAGRASGLGELCDQR